MNKTNLIIIACILVSILFWFWEPDIMAEYLAFSADNLLKGRVWTLFTALFLHANPAHLVGNMLFLFVFGNTLENEIKTDKTLSIFFVGGILSFILSIFFYDPTTLMVGASAAIFTLAATVMLVKPLKFSIIFLMPQGLVAIIYFTYNVIAVYFEFQGNVAYISHVIGFLIGIPPGILWSENWVKNLLITIGLLVIYLFIMLFVIPYITYIFAL